MSCQEYLLCSGSLGKESSSSCPTFMSFSSSRTKFNPPKDDNGVEFSIFILVFVSNTNLGENTKAVKLYYLKSYSFFIRRHADFRFW